MNLSLGVRLEKLEGLIKETPEGEFIINKLYAVANKGDLVKLGRSLRKIKNSETNRNFDKEFEKVKGYLKLLLVKNKKRIISYELSPQIREGLRERRSKFPNHIRDVWKQAENKYYNFMLS